MAREPQYREWVNTDGKTVLIRTDIRRREKGRIDSAFKSPIDGTIISNQQQLHEHNIRNHVVQQEPGWDSEVAQRVSEREQRASGERDIGERKVEIARAIEKLEKQDA